MKGITVITNNVEVMSFMSQSSIDVICSGGLQTSPNRYALVGPIAEETFRNIHADWAVFSACSLTEDCDSSKIGTNSTYYQCSLADIDYMVCDSKDAKHYQQMYPNLKII